MLNMFTHCGIYSFTIYLNLHLLWDALNVTLLFCVTMTINILIRSCLHFRHLLIAPLCKLWLLPCWRSIYAWLPTTVWETTLQRFWGSQPMWWLVRSWVSEALSGHNAGQKDGVSHCPLDMDSVVLGAFGGVNLWSLVLCQISFFTSKMSRLLTRLHNCDRACVCVREIGSWWRGGGGA